MGWMIKTCLTLGLVGFALLAIMIFFMLLNLERVVEMIFRLFITVMSFALMLAVVIGFNFVF